MKTLGPKDTWTPEEWERYRRLPWAGRALASLLVRFPKLARLLVARELRKIRR